MVARIDIARSIHVRLHEYDHRRQTASARSTEADSSPVVPDANL